MLDEIHRLPNPSEVLKIAADHYPSVRIIATGSSTLAASAKFRDTLSGRKHDLWLTPVLLEELKSFAADNLDRRMLQGGLPAMLLADRADERSFQEWLDGYWSRDIQELFRIERRASFTRLLELLLAQSGGLFDATRLATACEISRTTVANYLAVLDATFVAHVVRPFSTHRATEIVSSPRVYGFDTGFVACFSAWDHLRDEDRGTLWEHLVLNELHSRYERNIVHYWRDKRGHEVDFVLALRGNRPTAIECKWTANRFDPAGMSAFRRLYPDGKNLVVARDVDRPYSRRFDGIDVRYVGQADLWPELMGPSPM